MKWFCIMYLFFGQVLAVQAQNQHQRSYPLPESSVDSLFFYGLDLSPQFVERNKYFEGNEGGSHTLEVSFHGSLEDFPDVRRQQFRFHLNQEEHFYPSFYEDDDSVFMVLHNIQGARVLDAVVYAGQLEETSPISMACGCYPIKKGGELPAVKVKHEGKTGYFHFGKGNNSRPSRITKPAAPKPKGYIATSKPQYRITDTIQFKVFVLNEQGEPYSKGLRFQIASTSTRQEWRLQVSNNHPGSYHGFRQLSDSFYQGQFWLHVIDSSGNKVLSHEFSIGSYALPEYAIGARLKKEAFASDEKVQLYLSTYEANQWPALGLRYEWSVALTKVLAFKGQLAIPNKAFEELYKDEGTVDPSGMTVLKVPDSIFPVERASYRLKLRVLDVNGVEQYQWSQIVEKNLEPEPFKIMESQGVVALEVLDTSIAGTKGFSIESHSRFGHKERIAIKPGTPWPRQEGTITYSLYKEDSQIAVYAIPSAKTLQIEGYRSADSIAIEIQNPDSVVFFYKILGDARILNAGTTDELIYKAISDTIEYYHIEVFYSEKGLSKLVQKTFSFDPDRVRLNVKVPRIIAPGSFQRIEIEAIDGQGNLVAETDVTAFANDARFTDLPHSRLKGPSAQSHRLSTIPFSKASLSVVEGLSGAWFSSLSLYGTDSLQALVCPGREHRRLVQNEDFESVLTALVRDSGAWELPDFLWIDSHLIFSKVHYTSHGGSFVLPPGKHHVTIGYQGHLFTFPRVVIQKDKMSLLLFEPAAYPRYVPFTKASKLNESKWLKEAVLKSLKVNGDAGYAYSTVPLFALQYASGNKMSLSQRHNYTMRKVVGLGRSYYMYPFDPPKGAQVLLNDQEVQVDADSFYVYDRGKLTTKKGSPSLVYARLYLKPDIKANQTSLSSYNALDHLMRSLRRTDPYSRPRRVSYSSRITESYKKEYMPQSAATVPAHFYFEKGIFESLRLMNTEKAAASVVLDISDVNQRHFQLVPGTYLVRAITHRYPTKCYYDTLDVLEGHTVYYHFKKGRLTPESGFSYEFGDTLTWVAKWLVEGRKPWVSGIDFLGATATPSQTSEVRFQIHQAGGGTMIPLQGFGFKVTKDEEVFQLQTDANGWAQLSNLELGLYYVELIASEHGDTVKTFFAVTGKERIEVQLRVVSKKQYQQRKEIHYPHISEKQIDLKTPRVLNAEGFEKMSLGMLKIHGVDGYNGAHEGAHIQLKKNGIVLKEGALSHYEYCFMSLPAGEYTLVVSHVSFGKREHTVWIENNSVTSERYELNRYFRALKTVVISEDHSVQPSYSAPIRRHSSEASHIPVRFKRNRTQSHRSPTGRGVQIGALTEAEEDITRPLFQFMDANVDEVEDTLDISGRAPRDSVRDYFSELAYWEPSLLTNANGKAHFEVKFPDDLTTWKHYFIAMNQNGQAGLKYATSQSFKTLHTSLSVPRFLCQGDSLVLVGQHFNYEKEKKLLEETFSANGSVIHRQAMEIDNSIWSKTYVDVALEDSIELDCSIGTKETIFDKVRYTLPVKDTAVNRLRYTTELLLPGEVRTVRAKNEKVAIGFFPTSNDYLESLMAQLARYRYGCVEQTSSKLLALVYEAKLCKLNDRFFKKGKEVDLVINRLNSLKNDQGLWGWWNGQKTDWWMVSYATRALLAAQEEGFTINGGAEEPLAILSQFVAESNTRHPSLELLLLENGVKYSSSMLLNADGGLSLLEQLQLLRIQQLKGASNLKEKVLSLGTKVNGQFIWGEATYRMEDHASITTLCALEILFYEMPFEEWYNTYMMRFLAADNFGRSKHNTLEMARIIGLMVDVKYDRTRNLLINGAEWDGVRNEISLEPHREVRLENTSLFAMMLVVPDTSKDFSSKESGHFSLVSQLKKDGLYVDSLQIGEDALIEVTLYCTSEQEKLMLEVPLPAGCTPLPFNDRNGILHHRTFDDQVSVFCGHLAKGKHVFQIPVRASYEGSFTMRPTTASLMYFDFVSMSTPLRRIVVSPSSRSSNQ